MIDNPRDPDIVRRFAFPLNLSGVDAQFLERFWSKVDRRGPDECWPWLAYRKPTGYGQFTLRKGVFVTASRVALALASGPIDGDTSACHRCDNPPCCNPAHLFAGSQIVNALDCVAKGRANRSRGTAHRDCRLTEAAVRRIRSTAPHHGYKAELAREYGVSSHAIRQVLLRKTWGHVQ